YDNERRRIESWLSDLIKFDFSKKGKQISISLDSGNIFENPLHKAYLSKSFTSNDIGLHFFILDVLRSDENLSLNEITDKICDNYKVYFEPQIIRLKLKEYSNQGIVVSKKQGRSLVYSLSSDTCKSICQNKKGFIDVASFYSQSSPFGIVGYYILKQLGEKNKTFLAKHNYIVHTLDNNVLLTLLDAMNQKKSITILNFGKKQTVTEFLVVPLRIHISTQTGRRYLVAYIPKLKRFNPFRLDYIKSAKLEKEFNEYDYFKERYYKNLHLCWGTSFGDRRVNKNIEHIKMTISANEKYESYIVRRLKREGRGGTVTKIGLDTFLYEKEFSDASEATPWIKTFIGRIENFECENESVTERFFNDINEMYNMYFKPNEELKNI
ncbi:MAG: WYL domain-containing protein, partial [Clostridiales bacterium]|nr:WYL domain-containing protein [Clostridiales bacterium]